MNTAEAPIPTLAQQSQEAAGNMLGLLFGNSAEDVQETSEQTAAELVAAVASDPNSLGSTTVTTGDSPATMYRTTYGVNRLPKTDGVASERYAFTVSSLAVDARPADGRVASGLEVILDEGGKLISAEAREMVDDHTLGVKVPPHRAFEAANQAQAAVRAYNLSKQQVPQAREASL